MSELEKPTVPDTENVLHGEVVATPYSPILRPARSIRFTIDREYGIAINTRYNSRWYLSPQ